MTKGFDRLLRETLRTRTENPAGPCLDAEVVAGWFDDTLEARDRAAAAAHLAGCMRCQALLAAMARTAPPAVAPRWWRASFVRWLVPFAATATAVLVWVNLPEREVSSPLPTAVREATEPAERVQPPPANPSADAAAPAPASPDRRTTGSRAPSRDANQRVLEFAREASRSEDTSHARATPEAASPAAAESVTVTAPTPPPPASVANGAASRLSARARLAPPTTTIVSADASTQWRLTTSGAVSRSTDGGTTWETQSTGVMATLTAGVSPSSSVCWLVGEAGVVLITIDGRSWQRLAFPETIDLVSVRATDDRTATVSAADGRSFVTNDRGQTWQATRGQ